MSNGKKKKKKARERIWVLGGKGKDEKREKVEVPTGGLSGVGEGLADRPRGVGKGHTLGREDWTQGGFWGGGPRLEQKTQTKRRELVFIPL